MRALLLVVALLGCATGAASEPPEVDAWLRAWTSVRGCLVTPAEDIETGLALSLLARRDCGEPLRVLERSVPHGREPLLDAWRASITRLRRLDEHSPARAYVELARVEMGARLLAALHRRVVPVLPTGPRLPRLATRALPVTTWLAPGSGHPRGSLHRGTHRVLVSQHELGSYDLFTSPDDGQTVAHRSYRGVISRVRRYPDDARLELIVSRELHTLVPGRATASITPLDVPYEARWLCHHDGVTWSAQAHAIHRRDQSGDRALGPAPDGEGLRCRARAAVVIARDGVHRCTPQGCRRELTSPLPGGDGHAGLLEDGRWVFILQLERVTAIWVEGVEQPRLARTDLQVDWEAVLDGELVLEGEVVLFPAIATRS